ncbi:MAG: oxygen-dependent coproporphyrinogen oxidase, partial [Bdellovibrionales bacterium]|nr:oxygen-dependent coproporphyrinogen oxidase [Bdellovibrionales bacterium]
TSMQDLQVQKSDFHQYVKALQDEITKALFSYDSKLKLEEDLWQRLDHKGNPGGGGVTRAFSGEVIENAGVNTSMVFGAIDPAFAGKLGGTGDEMWACGISLIIHPRNPKVPTVHANFRMIHAGEKFWFGGGADLTPYYPHVEDFQYFHDVWKKALSPYGQYESMKQECDKYFVNLHRNNEMRGVGGFFFDHFNTSDVNADILMIKDISRHFIESYFPIVEKRKDEAFDLEDEDFQLHRRGRYVEFNLLHDRGTMFGLKTNGRTDSILISLPARAKFTYKYQPKVGSPHAKMMEYYYPRDWN